MDQNLDYTNFLSELPEMEFRIGSTSGYASPRYYLPFAIPTISSKKENENIVRKSCPKTLFNMQINNHFKGE